MKFKKIFMIGCGAIIALVLLVVGWVGLQIFYFPQRDVKRSVRYLKSMPDDEIQLWIAHSETILQSESRPDPCEVPKGNKERKPPFIYPSDDSVRYHFCWGIVCADLVVKRLPEGGHELIVWGEKFWPKEKGETP